MTLSNIWLEKQLTIKYYNTTSRKRITFLPNEIQDFINFISKQHFHPEARFEAILTQHGHHIVAIALLFSDGDREFYVSWRHAPHVQVWQIMGYSSYVASIFQEVDSDGVAGLDNPYEYGVHVIEMSEDN